MNTAQGNVNLVIISFLKCSIIIGTKPNKGFFVLSCFVFNKRQHFSNATVWCVSVFLRHMGYDIWPAE